jgi:transposase
MTTKIKRYSETLKRHIVAEYETGENIGKLQRKYGITGNNTIRKWVLKYGREGLRHEVIRIQSQEEFERVKVLERQIIELEQALGKMTLEKLKLESIVEELEESYGVEVKKKGILSSNDLPGKSATRESGG